MNARVHTIAIILIGLAGAARAQDERRPWRGAWYVEGETGCRHLGGRDEALFLEAFVGELDVSMRGSGDARGLGLEGTALDTVGEPPVLRERRARLEARGRDDGALDVTLIVDGEEPRRERWIRALPATVRIGVRVGGRAELAYDPRRGALTIELAVSGRPAAVRLQVRVADDDPRYAHLGGVLVHEELGRLAPGRHTFTWNGLDRALDPRPVLAGRYVVAAAIADEAAGPPLQGEGGTGGEQLLVVGGSADAGSQPAPVPVAVAPPEPAIPGRRGLREGVTSASRR